ncbi:Uncharacterised protein [Xylophilus ampelinus]|nr:Uncharacterised protein [Xylophilus ampelinus]
MGRDTIRIGGACAFWGDSNDGVMQLVRRGEVDVLVFDYLAELTLSIMASARDRKPELGYATDFVTALKPVLVDVARKGTLLLSNAGGMNPHACAQALEREAAAAGVSLKIAVVLGDDLLDRTAELQAAGVREFVTGAPMPASMNSINAYFGAAPVVEALRQGAQVVITGRCVDSALALAALIHRFDWSFDDFDRLSSGSLVGHMLECTTQTTGGLFTDWWKVPGWKDMGYPIAECCEDGSFELSKPDGTGGLITPLVAAEQMLYEVTDPANYLLPDVRCDFTAVTIEQMEVNRVRFAGARGSAPTPHYKVSATWQDGYRMTATLTFVGTDAVAMGRRSLEAIVARVRRLLLEGGFEDFLRVNIEMLGSEAPSFGAVAVPASREVVGRLAVHHKDPRALDLLAREVAPMGIAGAAGTTGFSGRQKAQPVYRLFSFLWPKSDAQPWVEIEGERFAVPAAGPVCEDSVNVGECFSPGGDVSLATTTVPLSAIAVARSGDKGDRAHVAVIARAPKFAALIGDQLGTAEVARWFAHLTDGAVARYEVPGIHAYNFVLEAALGGGGAASLRNDPLGKTFSQIILCHPIRVPTAWLGDIEPGFRGAVAA